MEAIHNVQWQRPRSQRNYSCPNAQSILILESIKKTATRLLRIHELWRYLLKSLSFCAVRQPWNDGAQQLFKNGARFYCRRSKCRFTTHHCICFTNEKESFSTEQRRPGKELTSLYKHRWRSAIVWLNLANRPKERRCLRSSDFKCMLPLMMVQLI